MALKELVNFESSIECHKKIVKIKIVIHSKGFGGQKKSYKKLTKLYDTRENDETWMSINICNSLRGQIFNLKVISPS